MYGSSKVAKLQKSCSSNTLDADRLRSLHSLTDLHFPKDDLTWLQTAHPMPVGNCPFETEPMRVVIAYCYAVIGCQGEPHPLIEVE